MTSFLCETFLPVKVRTHLNVISIFGLSDLSFIHVMRIELYLLLKRHICSRDLMRQKRKTSENDRLIPEEMSALAYLQIEI